MRKNRQYWLGLMLSVFVIFGYVCCGQALMEEETGLWLVEQTEKAPAGKSQAEAVGLVVSVQETENSTRYLLEDVLLQTTVGEVRLEKLVVYASHGVEIMEGDCVSVIGTLSSFDTATNPGQFDYRAYQASQGVYLQMYGQKITREQRGADTFLQMLGEVRSYVREIYLTVSPEMGGTMMAMVLGDKSNLPEERYQLYLETGIGHILTLSGLHLSLLGVGVHGILRRKITVPIWSAAVLVMSLLLIYLQLIGNGISAVRSAVAIGCLLMAGCLGKTYDSLSAAGLGMILILSEYPRQIERPSFWLSFGAVIAMGGILPELNRWLKPQRKSAKTLLSVLVVWIALMPVTAVNQYVVQPYSILLNFVVIPMMGPVLVGCILVLFVGMFFPQAGALIAVTVKLSFCVVDWLCGFSLELPWDQIVVGEPTYGQMAVYGAVLAVFLTVVCLENRKEWEQQATMNYAETDVGDKRRKGTRRRWLSLALVSVLLVSVLLFGIGRNQLELVFLDVGQGDCIFVRMPNGVTMMVDGGSTSEKAVGEERILPFLTWAGVRELDYLVVSHLDEDHVNGVIELLEAGFPVRYLLVSELTMDEVEVEEIGEISSQNGTIVVKIVENDHIICGEVEVNCIAPEKELIPDSENECSVVLELRYRNFSCLLTGDVEGDGERAVEEYVRERGVYTVLKVAHHGSKYSTSAEFLETVRPRAAVISCGENNSYGHPHGELIDRLEAVDAQVYCTAECGAVLVSTNGIRWSIEGYAARE